MIENARKMRTSYTEQDGLRRRFRRALCTDRDWGRQRHKLLIGCRPVDKGQHHEARGSVEGCQWMMPGSGAIVDADIAGHAKGPDAGDIRAIVRAMRRD